jgi:hypothetical protein
MADRLIGGARTAPVNALMVHQPPTSAVLMGTANPPAWLVSWVHMHKQVGTTVVFHDDRSWTVGMQEGTAGPTRSAPAPWPDQELLSQPRLVNLLLVCCHVVQRVSHGLTPLGSDQPVPPFS